MKRYIGLLRKGTQIGGAAVGGAVGSLAGPGGTVAGAAIGAAAGEACVVVLEDLAQRFLSPREEQRVGGVAAMAIESIRERRLWDEVRDDDFFDHSGDGPSPAEEIFEGVLLSAKQEHEELKLPFLANFYANLVFTPYVQRAEANYLLAIAESLTYRQFCILSLVNRKTEFELRSALWPGGSISADSLDAAQQALYLYQRQLLISYSEEYGRGGFVYEVNLVLPCEAILSSTGKRLVDLLGLDAISEDELRALAKAL
ncbi:hypothetical protein [Pseudomonas juntendi]|uniref:Uncharacterized protein n=1 Tax=Pseudomonas juntendi TaxID=2666183 RepID=A0A7W2LV46_9PSED|nr:hypothetical protein [Pseudomonas juntendi]MBA6134540.1 hypothetical protein [Pseudomonas juntendi]MBA6147645.1 hypothetical protein [Pseudomonas juntendi]